MHNHDIQSTKFRKGLLNANLLVYAAAAITHPDDHGEELRILSLSVTGIRAKYPRSAGILNGLALGRVSVRSARKR